MATVRIVETKLTDGSPVYEVRLSHENNTLAFDAISARDAERLAKSLVDAVNAHCNDLAFTV